MTQEEIIEGKKLIALFDCFEFIDDDKETYPDGYFMIIENGEYSNVHNIEELQYDSSWDWLMPVIEKIKSDKCGYPLQHYIYEHINRCIIVPNIKSTFVEIVRFIKWYNQQNK